MNGLAKRIMNVWKGLLAQKGQGLVEFALILAFCAGIGVAAREAGFAEAISNLLDSGEKTEDVAAAIGGPLAAERLTYGKYLAKWGRKTSEELEAINDQQRITADQKGLVAIAQNFLGKDANEVFYQIGDTKNNKYTFSNDFSGNTCPQFLHNNVKQNYVTYKDAEGWSNVLVPLSYKNYQNKDKDTIGYIWLEANTNTNTINAMTGDDAQAEMYKNIKQKDDGTILDANGKVLNLKEGTVLQVGTDKKTVSLDRVFYSNEMIEGEDRSVVLKVHYNSETNKVDQVRIAAVLGNGTQATSANPSAAAKGLDLTVFGSTSDTRYTVNNINAGDFYH